MRQLEVQPLAGFENTPIDEPAVFEVVLDDGRCLDYETTLSVAPAVTSSYDGLFSKQTVITSDNGLEHWDPSVNYPVGRYASFHGRNLEVLARVAIADQFGNNYQSLCIKGSIFTNPRFFEHETASREYLIHGLQESLVLERVLRASRVLRENSVDTEYICGLVIPESYPSGNPQHGMDVGKTEELPELLERLAAEFAAKQNPEGKSPLEIKAEMIDRFKDCDYLISYRAMDCPFRFGELTSPVIYERFSKFMLSNNPDDPLLKEYFEQNNFYFHINHAGEALAENLGKMHRAGITHGFLHANNITAMGSIVDLDSCKGEVLGLGDTKPSLDEELEDVMQAMDSIEFVLRNTPAGLGRVPSLKIGIDHAIHFNTVRMLDIYCRTRFDTPEEQREFLIELYDKFEHQPVIMDYNRARFAEVIHGTFFRLFGNREPGKLALPPERPIKLTREGSVFKLLPSIFFSTNRAMLLDEKWTMNDQHAELKHQKKPVRHPINGILRGLAFSQIFSDHGEIDASDASDILYTLGAIIDQDFERKTTTEEDQKTASQYMKKIIGKLIDRLSEVDGSNVNKTIQEYFGPGFEHVKLFLGQYGIEKGDESPVIDVLYDPGGVDDCESLFNIFGVPADTQVNIIDFHEINTVLKEAVDDPDGSLVIADFKLALKLTERHKFEEVKRTLFKAHPDFKPTVILAGLASEKPKVYAVRQTNMSHSDRAIDEFPRTTTVGVLEKILNRDNLNSKNPQLILETAA